MFLRRMGFLLHECKITVIDKKCFTDYHEQYLADPKSGPCPFFNVGDAFLLKRTPQQDDFYPLMLVNRAICGFLGSNSAILRSSAVQRYIPERLRSRVNALSSVLLTTGASVFSLLMGSGGSARLSLVRHVRRRCHPAGLSFSHRRQAAGRSKGVRGGLNPSRPHFVQRLLLAHRLIFQRDRLLDSPFSYPVLY